MTDIDVEVRERLASIRRRIEAACDRAGRDPASVTLVGASKRQPPERIRAAWDAGLRVFGENRVQEGESHRPLAPEADWHLIGPLQSNKAQRAIELFSTVQSVDRQKIALRLNRLAGEHGKRLDVFLEVNVGNEETKSGFDPGDFLDAIADFPSLSNLRILGLMAIPPFGRDPELARPDFRRLKELSVTLSQLPGWSAFPSLLSMGMSDDFEIAIEEGATHVRVGTALFGRRNDP